MTLYLQQCMHNFCAECIFVLDSLFVFFFLKKNCGKLFIVSQMWFQSSVFLKTLCGKNNSKCIIYNVLFKSDRYMNRIFLIQKLYWLNIFFKIRLIPAKCTSGSILMIFKTMWFNITKLENYCTLNKWSKSIKIRDK